jgi:iron-sulfur cluster repair protein YtfE (RIC family)
MKRHPSLVPLLRDHRRILFFAQVIMHGGASFQEAPTTTVEKLRYALSFYHDVLQAHLEREEVLLVPSVRGIDGEIDALLEAIVAEHTVIRQRVHRLAALTQAAEIEAALDQLGRLVEAHVRKEERQLFGRIQTVASEHAPADLQKKLQA